MKTAAVVGASGYAGGELIRFLDAHPEFELSFLGAHAQAGKRLGEVHPHLSGGGRLLEAFDADRVGEADAVFLALPHGASAEPAMALLERQVTLFDLGSDFRLDTPGRYLEAYGAEHPHPDQLGTWAYGIPELFGNDLDGASKVAVPGCYPTSVILALGPLLMAGVIDGRGVIVDSMSGVSGAGRGASDALRFGVIDESVKAYKVLTHRHRPEMERALDALAGGETQVVFTPHLVPMQRGILSTIHARMANGAAPADVSSVLRDAYDGSPFVSISETPPETRWVVGSNNARISPHVDERSGTVVLISAIDNLVKGAAGQAVQCANRVFGFDEMAGLPTTGWMP